METNSMLTDHQRIDNLADDALVAIFSYIDGEELLLLQVVCIKWHRVINTLINWKRRLEQKVRCCPVWKEVSKSCEISTCQTRSSYKARFEEMHRTIQEMDRNWRSGKFSEVDVDISGERYEDADDDFLVHSRGENIVVYDRRKMSVAHNMSGYDPNDVQITENILFLNENNGGFAIVDASSGTKLQIVTPKECEFISTVAVSTKMMAIFYDSGQRPNNILQLWQRENGGFELHSEQMFEADYVHLDMDDCYMALYEGFHGCVLHLNVHFSRNSHVERSMSVPVTERTFLYSKGYFYVIVKRGEIRIMEVDTGQWIRTFQHPRWTCPSNDSFLWEPRAAANSKYLATIDTTKQTYWSMESTVRIFDLVAARDPTCHRDNFHLATIHLTGFKFSSFAMNERELYGEGGYWRSGDQIFKSVDFLRTGSGRQVISSITQ